MYRTIKRPRWLGRIKWWNIKAPFQFPMPTLLVIGKQRIIVNS